MRLIVNPRKVADDIPEDVFLWVDTPGTFGEARFIRDQLVARDAFVNTTYLDVRYDRYISFTTKVKHEQYTQLGSAAEELNNQRFLGVINKAQYPLHLRSWDLTLNWKQLYSNRVPADKGALQTSDLTEIFSLLAAREINRNMSFTAGVEYEIANNLGEQPEGFLEDGTTLVLAGQIANQSAYQGYALTTNVGLRWTREDLETAPASAKLFTFISVFAGLGKDL